MDLRIDELSYNQIFLNGSARPNRSDPFSSRYHLPRKHR